MNDSPKFKTKGDIPILLLAAGPSSRMGQPKQLLNINGKTLLQRVVETAIEAVTGKTIVVLGSNEVEHRKIIDKHSVQILSNPDWKKGIGSSIKAGMTYIQKYLPESKAIIISVCDQPYLTGKHFCELALKHHNDNKQIVASSYKKAIGVPILFDRSFFDALLAINDSEGAKIIALNSMSSVVLVPFPQGEIDLDTMEDYNTFIQ